jgi:epoxide hydrolase-like predicted phosphatase
VIKAIIFDYFGIISSDEYWQSIKADKSMEEDFRGLSYDVNLGKLHWIDFVTQIAKSTGQSPDEIATLYKDQRLNPQVLAFINQLHKDYKTALLTNAHHEFLRPVIAKFHLERLFNEIVISSEVGMLKPNPAIFQYLLTKLGVSAGEAIFIDDIPQNSQAAAAIGLHAIIYKDFGQMKLEVEHMIDS